MQAGDRVFYFIDKSLEDPALKRRLGGIDYKRIIGRILYVYQPEQRMTAIDIEKNYGASPGTAKFKEFYVNGNTRTLRAVMKAKDGTCYLLPEKLWRNGFGDSEYVEKASNSFDFLYGDN